MTTEPRRARLALRSWGIVVLYMAVIFGVSSMSKLPDLAAGFSDKLEHACEYAVLGLLLARALAGARWRSLPPRHAIAVIALATLYGVSDEFHQQFVPGRDFDVRDMLADAGGASAAVGALWAWGIIKRFSPVSRPERGSQAPPAGSG